VLAAPDVERASLHNLALAPFLLGAQNACNAPVRMPTESDIFSVADARVVSLVPQAGNTTSDLANASVIWSWSASFPAQARFSIREDERCPAGAISYNSPSSPSFSGALAYRYGNSTETAQLSLNPVRLNLSAEKLTEEDFSAPFANLSVSLSGTVSVTYSFSKSSYSYACKEINGYIGCGCEQKYESGLRTFSKPLEDSRNFSVEAGPVSMLWLNPPLQSRLEGQGEGKVAFFARRLPSGILFSFSGNGIANSFPYSFSTSTGPCGEKIVERAFSPSGSAFFNTSAPIAPFQLVGKNASYFPFYAEFPWHASAGKAEFEIIFEDAFSHSETFVRNFSVRQATQLYSAGSSLAMLQQPADDKGTGASFPALQKQGAFPDFAVLAAAFALPLAIGAAALCRRLEWL